MTIVIPLEAAWFVAGFLAACLAGWVGSWLLRVLVPDPDAAALNPKGKR